MQPKNSSKPFLSQVQKLDALFKRQGDYFKVPLPEICALGIAAYSRRIEELREEYGREDYLIVNYQERGADGITRSWYAREPRGSRPRWEPKHKRPVPADRPDYFQNSQIHRARKSAGAWRSQPVAPSKPWEQVVRERDQALSQPQPEFSLVP